MEYETFGQALRAFRDKAGLTTRELSDITGIDETTLSKWENGVRFPGRKEAGARVLRLEGALGVTDNTLYSLWLNRKREITEHEAPPDDVADMFERLNDHLILIHAQLGELLDRTRKDD